MPCMWSCTDKSPTSTIQNDGTQLCNSLFSALPLGGEVARWCGMAPKPPARGQQQPAGKSNAALQQQAADVQQQLRAAARPAPVTRGVTGLSALTDEATAQLATQQREQSKPEGGAGPSRRPSDPAADPRRADATPPQAHSTVGQQAAPAGPVDMVRTVPSAGALLAAAECRQQRLAHAGLALPAARPAHPPPPCAHAASQEKLVADAKTRQQQHVAAAAERNKLAVAERAKRRAELRHAILTASSGAKSENPFVGPIVDPAAAASSSEEPAKAGGAKGKGAKGKAGKGAKGKAPAPPPGKKSSSKMLALQHTRPGEKPKGLKKWMNELDARGWSKKKTALVRTHTRARTHLSRLPATLPPSHAPRCTCGRVVVAAVRWSRGLVRGVRGGVHGHQAL